LLLLIWLVMPLVVAIKSVQKRISKNFKKAKPT